MPYLPIKRSTELEILIPGCGNSGFVLAKKKKNNIPRPHQLSHSFKGLGKAIHSRGFCNITNIDVSPVVISQMIDLHSDLEEMECKNSHFYETENNNLLKSHIISIRCCYGCQEYASSP